MTLKQMMRLYEGGVIRSALRVYGSIPKAAEKLGISRVHMWRLCRKHHVPTR